MSTLVDAAGPRSCSHVMGTVVTVDIRGGGGTDDAGGARVRAGSDEVDDRFSAWKPDSETSRFARGELDEPQLSPDLREVLVACEQVRGAQPRCLRYPPPPARWPARPTGLVKGWSVDRAVSMLEEADVTDFSVNAGGDAVVRGRPEPGRPWRVGIQHPAMRDAWRGWSAAPTSRSPRPAPTSVASTSSTPGRAQPPTGLVSMTVIGPELGLADAYATAAFVMGASAGLGWLDGIPDYSGCAITDDGQMVWTPGFDRYLET